MKTAKFILYLIIFQSNFLFSEPYSKLKTIEIKMINILGLFSNGTNQTIPNIDEIKNKVHKELKTISKSDFKYITTENQNILFSNLILIDSLVQFSLKSDSIRNSMTSFLNKFYLLYLDSLLEYSKDSKKYKIFLFSTSVSCQCTLNKCQDFESKLYNQTFKHHNKFDCLVIDSFKRKDIMKRFSVGFVPTLILLDNNNKEIKRFEIEGKIEDLIEFIKFVE